LFKDMTTITELFNQNTALIHDDFERMFTYFDNQHQLNNEIKQTFEQTATDIKSFVGNQSNVIDGFMKNNYNLHKSYKTLVDQSQQEIQQSHKDMNEFFQVTTGQIDQMISKSESQTDMHKQLTEAVYKQIKKEQASLLKQLKESNTQNVEVKDSFSTVVSKMETYMTSQESSSKALGTSLAGISSNISSNISKTNELIVSLDKSFSKRAEETPAAIKSLEAPLNDLKKSIETLSGKMVEKEYAINLTK
jgi:hypothetical protein